MYTGQLISFFNMTRQLIRINKGKVSSYKKKISKTSCPSGFLDSSLFCTLMLFNITGSHICRTFYLLMRNRKESPDLPFSLCLPFLVKVHFVPFPLCWNRLLFRLQTHHFKLPCSAVLLTPFLRKIFSSTSITSMIFIIISAFIFHQVQSQL